MSDSTREGRDNCPNCGAPIDSDKCPYCGTRFIDFAAMDTKEPFWLKVKTPRGILTLRVRLREVSLQNPTEEVYTTFSDELRGVSFMSNMRPELTLRMDISPVDGMIAEWRK